MRSPSTTICDVPGCGRSEWARGKCSPHYQRFQKAGELDQLRPRLRVSLPKLRSIRDLLGQTFGTLTVVDVAKLGAQNGLIVTCSCEVHEGRALPRPMSANSLRRSPGCHKNATLDEEEQFYISAWKIHKFSGNKRHGSYLSYREFLNMCVQPCVVCGLVDNRTLRGRIRGVGSPKRPLNTIDRINNTIGYTRPNCQPTCKLHNGVKAVYDNLFGSKKVFICPEAKENATIEDVHIDIIKTFEITARGYGYPIKITGPSGDDWLESW